MKVVLLTACLWSAMTAACQTMSVSVTNAARDEKSGMSREVKDLFEFLDVEHYTARFKMPDKKKHDVVLVMKSVYRDSIAFVDTLMNSVPWQKKVVGGFMWDPASGATFMAEEVDSMHMHIRSRFWMVAEKTIELPWPNHGYSLNEGLRSGGKFVTMEYGKPMPIMVLTQPYPDPPPPKEAVMYRYCFGSEVPPEQWPVAYGVPHLYVFELTVLP